MIIMNSEFLHYLNPNDFLDVNQWFKKERSNNP